MMRHCGCAPDVPSVMLILFGRQGEVMTLEGPVTFRTKASFSDSLRWSVQSSLVFIYCPCFYLLCVVILTDRIQKQTAMQEIKGYVNSCFCYFRDIEFYYQVLNRFYLLLKCYYPPLFTRI